MAHKAGFVRLRHFILFCFRRLGSQLNHIFTFSEVQLYNLDLIHHWQDCLFEALDSFQALSDEAAVRLELCTLIHELLLSSSQPGTAYVWALYRLLVRIRVPCSLHFRVCVSPLCCPLYLSRNRSNNCPGTLVMSYQ